MRTMLVYGATGKAGRLVVERALQEGWKVTAFVRNPDKVPEAVRAKVTVVKGDLSDAATVAAAVRSSRPDAIVDASSALPFGHAKGQPPNSADRGVLTKATISASAPARYAAGGAHPAQYPARQRVLPRRGRCARAARRGHRAHVGAQGALLQLRERPGVTLRRATSVGPAGLGSRGTETGGERRWTEKIMS